MRHLDDQPPPREPAELAPEHLRPNAHWAIARMFEAEPFWMTLLQPKRSEHRVWVVDAIHADGRRAVAVVGGDVPLVAELEGEIAAPLSMSTRRVHERFEVLGRSFRDAPSRIDDEVRAAVEAAIRAHPTLASVRVIAWPVLKLRPRFPFAEPYLAFVGPAGYQCIARATPRPEREPSFLMDILDE